jgi:hypothetical protein
LDNLKSGNKSVLESSRPKGINEPNLLSTKPDDDLDKLWSGAIKQNTTP